MAQLGKVVGDRRRHSVGLGEDILHQPTFKSRTDRGNQQKTPDQKKERFEPLGHRALLDITLEGLLRGAVDFDNSSFVSLCPRLPFPVFPLQANEKARIIDAGFVCLRAVRLNAAPQKMLANV